MWVKYVWLEHIVGFTVHTILGHTRGHRTSGWLSLSNAVIDPRIWDISAWPLLRFAPGPWNATVMCCFNTLQVSAPKQSLSKQLSTNWSTLSAEIFSLVSKWLFSSSYDSFYIFFCWPSGRAFPHQLGLLACPEIQFLLERKNKSLIPFTSLQIFRLLLLLLLLLR